MFSIELNIKIKCEIITLSIASYPGGTKYLAQIRMITCQQQQNKQQPINGNMK